MNRTHFSKGSPAGCSGASFVPGHGFHRANAACGTRLISEASEALGVSAVLLQNTLYNRPAGEGVFS